MAVNCSVLGELLNVPPVSLAILASPDSSTVSPIPIENIGTRVFPSAARSRTSSIVKLLHAPPVGDSSLPSVRMMTALLPIGNAAIFCTAS